jgi:starch synthase
MRILFVSSELAPFAKTGGLGDVSAALPRALRAAGHDVRVVVPMYARVRAPGREFVEVVPTLRVRLGEHDVRAAVYASTLPDSDVPVYFVRCAALYDRPNLYDSAGDEHLRFGLLNWAALMVCQHLGFSPDIAHVNDWQTALIPLLAQTLFAWDRRFSATRTVLTIHNLGHQGTFGADTVSQLGLDPVRGHLHQDELHAGRLGFLRTGIQYANAITTVSPTYAREILTAEGGVGLDDALRSRRDVLRGILNGIDDTEWNPARDPHLAHTFTADDLSGKARCKAALLASAGLAHRPEVPVVGVVSRLVWQKGFDLCEEVLPGLLRRGDFQLVALGSGEPRYEEFFRSLVRHFPRQVAYVSAFSERLAHAIEAGADMFLMPSRYEPCGLNQMYSLRYGTPPIVHRTGGLADTVRNFDRATGEGTGFVFNHFDGAGLRWAITRALEVWGSGAGDDRARWASLQRNGMREPLGWQHRVGEYLSLYRALCPGVA